MALMRYPLRLSQYLVLLAVMLSAPVGDSLLARGMRQVGQVDLHHLSLLWYALFNPFVDVGIVLLICFFASYTTALSPAIGALTYIGNAVSAKLFLQECVDRRRWLATLCVAIGVLLLR